MIKRLGWRGPLWAAAGRGRALSYGLENSSSLSALACQLGAASRASRKRSILARAAEGFLAPSRSCNTPQVRFTLRRISTAVLQAALLKRPCKPIETSRSVMHQKTGVVRAQNRRRLRIPTMRLNHINSDLFAQQDPQILRACSSSPAGVVQPYHGVLPQLTLQLLVGGGC